MNSYKVIEITVDDNVHSGTAMTFVKSRDIRNWLKERLVNRAYELKADRLILSMDDEKGLVAIINCGKSWVRFQVTLAAVSDNMGYQLVESTCDMSIIHDKDSLDAADIVYVWEYMHSQDSRPDLPAAQKTASCSADAVDPEVECPGDCIACNKYPCEEDDDFPDNEDMYENEETEDTDTDPDCAFHDSPVPGVMGIGYGYVNDATGDIMIAGKKVGNIMDCSVRDAIQKYLADMASDVSDSHNLPFTFSM